MKYFTKNEFEKANSATKYNLPDDCNKIPEDLTDNLLTLAEQLDVIREEINEPLLILSGYRSPGYNKAVGGAENSYHKKAMAADIVAKGITAKELKNVIIGLIEEDKIIDGGVGGYSTFIHYDIGKSRRW